MWFERLRPSCQEEVLAVIGLYDSGLGGLWIMHAVRRLLPQHNLYYLADTAFCPYGSRSTEEVRKRALACARWLVDRGAHLVVVACNTASSAALEVLRAELSVPIVGMEPGIKPAIESTRVGRVGVLATGGTLAGARFARLVERFASEVQVQTVPCPGLVERIEVGDLYSPQTRQLLQHYLTPLMEQGVDTIVLGCTHYLFLQPLLVELLKPDITIIDTGPAVAQQVARVAAMTGLVPDVGRVGAATTGDPASVGPVFAHLWGEVLPLEHADC